MHRRARRLGPWQPIRHNTCPSARTRVPRARRTARWRVLRIAPPRCPSRQRSRPRRSRRRPPAPSPVVPRPVSASSQRFPDQGRGSPLQSTRGVPSFLGCSRVLFLWVSGRRSRVPCLAVDRYDDVTIGRLIRNSLFNQGGDKHCARASSIFYCFFFYPAVPSPRRRPLTLRVTLSG